MFRHPKYYKELRKLRNKSDQAISPTRSDGWEASVRLVRAPSNKLQAPSNKLQAPSSSKNKLQASSPKQQASSFKPQASSSRILDPSKSFTAPEPRASTKIKLLRGCLNERQFDVVKRTLLLFVTFNSTVKKVARSIVAQ